MTRSRRKGRNRAGTSLVEVLVTMVLVSVFMVSLVPLTLRMAKVSNDATTLTQRAAVMNGEVARLEVLAFDALPTTTACSTVSRSLYHYSSCVSVSSVDFRTKRVTVIVTPANGVRADTTVLNRYKENWTNPLAP